MAVSATATKEYTVDEIVSLAMVTAGVLNPQHYARGEADPAELAVGRAWLFFKLQSLQSSGMVLRARERAEQPLVTAQAYVDLANDTLSIEEGVIVRHSDGITERQVTLINLLQYQQGRPDKTVQGTPVQAYPEQQSTGAWRLYLWPVPDGEYTTISIPRTRRLRDVEPGNVTLDLDRKMHLALLTHLAARFAGSKGRAARAGELSVESGNEQARAENDETDRGGVQFVVDGGIWD